jgi:hypothetical protein
MEGVVGSGLFKTFNRSVHGLTCGGEGAGGQHLDLLCVLNFGVCFDNFLTGFLELLGEVSELQHLSFDEGVPQLLDGPIDDGLVRLPELKDLLSKRVER